MADDRCRIASDTCCIADEYERRGQESRSERGGHRTRGVIEKNDQKDQAQTGRVVYHDVMFRASRNAP